MRIEVLVLLLRVLPFSGSLPEAPVEVSVHSANAGRSGPGPSIPKIVTIPEHQVGEGRSLLHVSNSERQMK